MRRHRSRRSRRRGVLLLAGIVCVMLVSAVAAGLMRTAVRQRLRAQRQAWQQQAAWLAQSGLERGARRLAADAEYRGETWAAATEPPSRVVIRVAPAADGWQLEVQADYPDDPFQRARESRTVQLGKRSGTAPPSEPPVEQATEPTSVIRPTNKGDGL